MLFLNPYFLFGLTAIAVPVIIHLFNFRKYKKVYFTNVKFMQELRQQTRKTSDLRHLIILFLRILAIVSLVLAFARPYIPRDALMASPSATHKVVVYVDNSFSMESQGVNGSLIDEALRRAAEIAGAYRPADQFVLITNDFEARHRRWTGREDFLNALTEVKPGPVNRNPGELIQLVKELAGGDAATVYLISDFRKSSVNAGSIGADSLNRYFLLPLTANKVNNVYIDSCWFESPLHLAGQNVKLWVRVKNQGSEKIDKVPLKLTINGRQRAVSSISASPSSVTDLSIAWNEHEKGIMSAVLSITDQPVVFDDNLYFSYSVMPSVPVLCISGESSDPYLGALLGNDSAFVYTRVSQESVDYSSISSRNLVILDGLKEISSGLAGELSRFVSSGGHLLVIPSATGVSPGYQSFLQSMGCDYYLKINRVKQKVAGLNLRSRIFSDVFDRVPENMDLPAVNEYYTITRQSRAGQEVLMTLQNGDVFLGSVNCGSGKVYLLAVPLVPAFSNFPRHAVFVPAIYNIALMSQSGAPLYYTLGTDEVVQAPLRNLPSGEETLRLRLKDSEAEFVPAISKGPGTASLLFHGEIREAGNYILYGNRQALSGVSFNYNRRESDLGVADPAGIVSAMKKAGVEDVSVLSQTGKPLSGQIEEMNQGLRLWKIFVVLALLFLAGEVLLLRFWK